MRLLTAFLISFAILLLAPAPRAEAAAPTMQNLRSQVLDSVARQLTEHFHSEGTLTLELQRPWNPPLGNGTLEVAISEFPNDLATTMLVKVQIVSDGQLLTEPTLILKGQLLREVWVSKSQIEREALFDTANFETRNVDVLRERNPVPSSEPLKDMIIARGIASNHLLLWSDVAKRPLVRRGDYVEVAATDGSMTIVLRALAMESGSAGDFVKVRNLDSRKDFNAMVVADARAEVRF